MKPDEFPLRVIDARLPLNVLLARLERDKVSNAKVVQVRKLRYGVQSRSSYFMRMLATEHTQDDGSLRYYTYTLKGDGRVLKSWAFLSAADLTVEQELAQL